MNVHASLYRNLKETADRIPKREGLLYMGKSFLYGDMIKKVDETAGALKALGINTGDPVTICMPNIPETIYAFYAVSKIGAIAHMVHPLAPANQLKRFMESAGSKKALFILNTRLKECLGPISELGAKIISCSPASSLGGFKNAMYSLINRKEILKPDGRTAMTFENFVKLGGIAEEVTTDGEPTAAYLHSGGTSGDPKVIALSARAINALSEKGYYILNIEDGVGAYMLAALPMFHGFGLCMGVHAMMLLGGTSCLMPKFSADETVKLIAKNKLNILIGVPALYENLLRHKNFNGEKLKNLNIAFVGGDCVLQSLMDRFDARIKEGGGTARLFEGYGLTETVTVCNVNIFRANRTGSIGKSLPGITNLVVNEKMEPLPAGEQGEILISGDTLMSGYLNDPEATAAAFVNVDGKRFVRTGDCGILDSDGFLFFKQRLKRIIKIAGISVFPTEIESAASKIEGAGITEACAVEGKDEKGRTIIVLFVRSDLPENERKSDEYICAAIKNELSGYAVPRKIVYIDEFPKTLIGKINTIELTKKYLS